MDREGGIRERPETPRRTAGARARDTGRRGTRSPVLGAQPAESQLRERLDARELLAEHGGAKARESIRTPSLDGLERLDEPAFLEPRQCRIEGARAEWPAGAGLDVGHDRVAVLRPIAQADEDQEARLGKPTELEIGIGFLHEVTWQLSRG